MLRQPAVIVICPDLFSTMTISLVLFSARHCLFPARFRLAYYRALLYSLFLSLYPFPLAYLLPPPPVLLLTVFRQILPLFFPFFSSSFFFLSFSPSPSLAFPTIASSTLARFLAPRLVSLFCQSPRSVRLSTPRLRSSTNRAAVSIRRRLSLPQFLSSVFDVSPRPRPFCL